MCKFEINQTDVRGWLKHKKIQDVTKLNRRNYHLPKDNAQHKKFNKKAVGFKKNIKKHGLRFHYSIR